MVVWVLLSLASEGLPEECKVKQAFLKLPQGSRTSVGSVCYAFSEKQGGMFCKSVSLKEALGCCHGI